jgi:1-pyrroline-5-carboxylate dehydrogenase
VETTTTKDPIFTEEIFGPVLAVYVYKDSEVRKVLNGVTEDTPYALTGAMYSTDQ